MPWMKIFLFAVVVVGFGFYSFQKGREYERGLVNINREKNNKNKFK